MKLPPLAIGDVIEITIGMLINAKLPKHFLYANRTGDWTIGHENIEVGNRGSDFLRGHYAIQWIENDHVSAVKIRHLGADDEEAYKEAIGIEIDFYINNSGFPGLDVIPVGFLMPGT